MVIAWSPATIRWIAASSESCPVTGGSGFTPPPLSAAIAPPAVPSLAAYTPPRPFLGGFSLLLLLGRVLVGVAVDQLALRAGRLQRLGEQRAVEGLVPGGLRLGQQQRDLLGVALAAGVA